MHELLVENLHVVEVVVGENFTFGKKAAGNVETLRRAGERFGFAVESMSLLSEHHSNENVTFSSTYIRSCVDAGDVMAATEALGRPHRVEGVVVRGYGRGSELGYPTANVAPPMYSAIPADGVYAAWFTVLGHGPSTGTVIPGSDTRVRCRSAPTRRSPGAPALSRLSSWTPRPTSTASMWRWTSSPESAASSGSTRSTSWSPRSPATPSAPASC